MNYCYFITIGLPALIAIRSLLVIQSAQRTGTIILRDENRQVEQRYESEGFKERARRLKETFWLSAICTATGLVSQANLELTIGILFVSLGTISFYEGIQAIRTGQVLHERGVEFSVTREIVHNDCPKGKDRYSEMLWLYFGGGVLCLLIGASAIWCWFNGVVVYSECYR